MKNLDTDERIDVETYRLKKSTFQKWTASTKRKKKDHSDDKNKAKIIV